MIFAEDDFTAEEYDRAQREDGGVEVSDKYDQSQNEGAITPPNPYDAQPPGFKGEPRDRDFKQDRSDIPFQEGRPADTPPPYPASEPDPVKKPKTPKKAGEPELDEQPSGAVEQPTPEARKE